MRAIPTILLAAVLSAAPAGFAVASEQAQALLDQAAIDCSDYEGGEFSASPSWLTAVDLTGDGVDDEIVDEGFFLCTSTEQMFCGGVGCTIHAIVDGQRFGWVAYSWTVVEWETSRILLLSRHGTICGSPATDDACYEALVWNGNRFLSVAPPPIE
ncbi:MAG: hypothetical protein ACFCVH_01605 [Alphaproteobacteria bacterium]